MSEKPRFDYDILKKGGVHEKTKKAKRKREKDDLRREVIRILDESLKP